ncbi:FHA domain-containing protein [Amnibacterium setariae]|uniref:FHA domain-containing protein n=1 Tax=Amnibacterium setariae TaxID=2306585 RepID=A0A3A1U7V5_9MICO|nr:FHA domain-containing protein [Amnibacterium setariae]RIX31128.1 FHA domain-containing protein [Amnibacterium setariae]
MGTGAFYSADVLEPGADWRLLVTDRFLGAFGPSTSVSTMSTLWRIAADDALGLDALVGAIPSRGVAAVDSFAIAALGRVATFVVRGGGCADVSVGGRVRRVDARGSEPWYVAELTGVERFQLGPLQRSPGDLTRQARDLPIDGGVVFGPWLGWSSEAAAAPRSAPTPVQQPAQPPLSSFDPHDTNVLGDLGRRAASLRRHRGEPPATAPTPETESATAFRLGDRAPERVDAPVYVGRQPRSPRVTGGVLPRLVRVDSPSREVSATHIELRPTREGLVLTDLESTNGTVVRQPGTGVRRLESGESLPVVPGTLIDIGDGNVIEILAYR